MPLWAQISGPPEANYLPYPQDMLSEGGVLLLQEMFLSYDLDKGKGLHDYFYEHAFLRNTTSVCERYVIALEA